MRNIRPSLSISVFALLMLCAGPASARFLQTDPVGYKDDVNLYEYAKDDPVDHTDPSGKDSFEVSRTITEAGFNTPYDHTFTIVSDKPGGAIRASFDYGPQNGGSGNLINGTNGKLVSTGLTSTDAAAWKASQSPNSGVRIEKIPASDPAVIAAGQSLNKTLGTAANPGNIDYAHSPNGTNVSGNSNSATSTLVNNAVQATHPGAPNVNPPAGSNAPGSSVRITSPNCVSGPGGSSCKM